MPSCASCSTDYPGGAGTGSRHAGSVLALARDPASSRSRSRTTRAAAPAAQARNRFLECKTFIEANAIKMRSLDEICRTLHVDPSNLSRLFRRFQGGSPYQYLLRCRMNRRLTSS